MVKLTLTLVSILSFTTVGLSASVRRSVETVDAIKADISQISSGLTTLGTNVDKFPKNGGSLAAALTIHTEAQTLAVSLKKCGADVIATGPIAASDGTTILNMAQALLPSIKFALTGLSDKKAAFSNLGVTGAAALILVDLRYLRGNTSDLANDFVANNDASLTGSFTTLRNQILPLFDDTIAVYST